LANSKRAAIAQLVTRGKEQLVLIRPYQDGLIMHSLYYANEVRNFAEIGKGENSKLSTDEIKLGADLIESMSDELIQTTTATNTASEFRRCWKKKAKARRSRLQRQKRHSMLGHLSDRRKKSM
jgi:DNA end-binding protein Ku